jgi:hypothetical protein
MLSACAQMMGASSLRAMCSNDGCLEPSCNVRRCFVLIRSQWWHLKHVFMGSGTLHRKLVVENCDGTGF